MLRKALLTLITLSAGSLMSGCSDDDFGQERPPTDASASVTDGGPDGATDAGADLTPAAALPDLLPKG